ncbi:MAG: sulfatase [Actinomycetota bacterium]|nr:sulfatase [Actinomycetota bacterium]
MLPIANATTPVMPASPEVTQPNIVLVLSDDQSPDSISAMPYVSAASDWIDFENAFFNVALCCPSRASILSGQYAHHSGVWLNSDGPRFRDTDSVATWLNSAGYRTGLIGKYLNNYPYGDAPFVPPGWDDWQAFTGEVEYFDYTMTVNGSDEIYGSKPSDYSTDVLARKAQKFIETSVKPFFLMVAPHAPHVKAIPAPRHAHEFSRSSLTPSPNFNEADVSDKPRWVQQLPAVDASVAHEDRLDQYRTLLSLDDLIRDVFLTLERSRILEETVVIFMTDNGYSFGEHRWTGKRCEYDECMKTPLLIRYPGQGGKKVRYLAQNVDLASTIAELAGVTPTIRQDGRSLAPILRGETVTDWRTGLLLSNAAGDKLPEFWGIRTERWKYVELATGERELYDLEADPQELDNRAGDVALATIEADLAGQLEVLKNEGGAGSAPPRPLLPAGVFGVKRATFLITAIASAALVVVLIAVKRSRRRRGTTSEGVTN